MCRQNPVGPVDPSFRALCLKSMVRRHKFNNDSLSFPGGMTRWCWWARQAVARQHRFNVAERMKWMISLKSIHPQTRRISFNILCYEIKLTGLWGI